MFGRKRHVLDQPVFRWDKKDWKDLMTKRDLLRSILGIGAAGSGKSSGPGKAIDQAMIAHADIGGLLICSKPEDAPLYRSMIPPHRVVFIGPNHPNHWNYFDALGDTKSPTYSKNATNFLVALSDNLQGGEKGGGGDGRFWELQQDRTLFNSIELIRQADGRVTAPGIQKLIVDAPTTQAMISDEGWKKGYFCQVFERALKKEGKTPVEAADFDLITDFWLREWPRMADKTRSSLVAECLGTLHPFNSGITRVLCSTDTTMDYFAFMDRGGWVVIDMSLREFGDGAKIVLAGAKLLTQDYVLRREWDPNEQAIITIKADEAHNYVNRRDPFFLAECRSHGGCMFYLTQSIHSFYAAMGGNGEHHAEALLTGFHHKLFTVVGDPKTASWASNLLGQRIGFLTNTTPGQPRSPGQELFDNSGGSCSVNQHWEPILQPNVFMGAYGMRTGGPGHRFMVDAVLIRESSFRYVAFDQRG